jgi:hypothetical protein
MIPLHMRSIDLRVSGNNVRINGAAVQVILIGKGHDCNTVRSIGTSHCGILLTFGLFVN